MISFSNFPKIQTTSCNGNPVYLRHACFGVHCRSRSGQKMAASCHPTLNGNGITILFRRVVNKKASEFNLSPTAVLYLITNTMTMAADGAVASPSGRHGPSRSISQMSSMMALVLFSQWDQLALIGGSHMWRMIDGGYHGL